MDKEQWYRHLDSKELEGKHVRAVFGSHVVFEGELSSQGFIKPTTQKKAIQVLEHNGFYEWSPVPEVSSLSLMWDDRDFVQIDSTELDTHSYVVINGHRHEVVNVDTRHDDGCPEWVSISNGRGGTFEALPIDMVSYCLRWNEKPPKKRGMYLAHDGSLLVRTDKWTRISNDFSDIETLPDEREVCMYMPLVEKES